MPWQNQNTDTQSPMPYQINGPTLEWTNDAGLFTRFTLWKQKCELILDCQLENASDARKAKSVLQWSGDRGLEIYNSWCIKDTTDDNLQEYWHCWTAYCQPHANAQHAQFDLWHNSSQQNKSIEEHYANILNQSQIAFPQDWPADIRNTLSCDAFVFNLHNHDLMQKCIREKANLNRAKEIAKTDESSKAAIQHFTGSDKGTAEIHQLRHQCHKVPTPKSAYKHKCKQHQAHRGSPFKKCKLWNPRSEGGPSHYSGDTCSKCGDSKHRPGFYCPAQKFKCQNCHKTGHFTSCCFHRGKQDKYHKNKPKDVHGITTQDGEHESNTLPVESDQESTSSNESFFVGTITAVNKVTAHDNTIFLIDLPITTKVHHKH